MAAPLPLNSSRKSSVPTDSHAIALDRVGGIEPLYSGATNAKEVASRNRPERGSRPAGMPAAWAAGV